MDFFIWVEGTAISEWVRGSPSLWGFPFILFLHTLGLALLAGLSSALACGILFWPARVPRAPFDTLFPLMWIGFGINAISGLLLLAAYPAKALTNPVFYVKMSAITIAVIVLLWLRGQLSRPAAVAGTSSGAGAGAGSGSDAGTGLRRAAWTLLGLWLTATFTGRLLAYTHSILMAREPNFY